VVEDEIQAYLYMLENVVLPRMAEAGAPKWTSMIDVSLIEYMYAIFNIPYTIYNIQYNIHLRVSDSHVHCTL